jgi:hypothetical protein
MVILKLVAASEARNVRAIALRDESRAYLASFARTKSESSGLALLTHRSNAKPVKGCDTFTIPVGLQAAGRIHWDESFQLQWPVRATAEQGRGISARHIQREHGASGNHRRISAGGG